MNLEERKKKSTNIETFLVICVNDNTCYLHLNPHLDLSFDLSLPPCQWYNYCVTMVFCIDLSNYRTDIPASIDCNSMANLFQR